jgi:lycopene cyclase CruP
MLVVEALADHVERKGCKSTRSVIVQVDALSRHNLGLINTYNPGISSAWMLQRAMGVRIGEKVAPNLVNRMLGANFAAMEATGDRVMRPFLQDVMQFGPFAQTVIGQVVRDPLFIVQIMKHVGFAAMLDWAYHFFRLGLHRIQYAVMLRVAKQDDEGCYSEEHYRRRRKYDALKYGSGSDFTGAT